MEFPRFPTAEWQPLPSWGSNSKISPQSPRTVETHQSTHCQTPASVSMLPLCQTSCRGPWRLETAGTGELWRKHEEHKSRRWPPQHFENKNNPGVRSTSLSVFGILKSASSTKSTLPSPSLWNSEPESQIGMLTVDGTTIRDYLTSSKNSKKKMAGPQVLLGLSEGKAEVPFRKFWSIQMAGCLTSHAKFWDQQDELTPNEEAKWCKMRQKPHTETLRKRPQIYMYVSILYINI